MIWNIEDKKEPINVKIIYNNERTIDFGDILPLHWLLLDIDDYENAKNLIVILNNEIRNIFHFDEYREEFKKVSYRENYYR